MENIYAPVLSKSQVSVKGQLTINSQVVCEPVIL